MRLLSKQDIAALNALTSANLAVTATSQKITMRLTALVALTNFKALASAGRIGTGAQFDSKTKTLTVDLLSPIACKSRDMRIGSEIVTVKQTPCGSLLEVSDEEWAATTAIYPFSNLSSLEKLAQRLSGKKAKIFSTASEMNAQRKKKVPRMDRSEMDMPMWDPIRKEWYDLEIETR